MMMEIRRGLHIYNDEGIAINYDGNIAGTAANGDGNKERSKNVTANDDDGIKDVDENEDLFSGVGGRGCG